MTMSKMGHIDTEPELGHPREFRDTRYLLPLTDPKSPMTERYRRLRATVEHLGERQGRELRTLVVSSSRENEGKTLTALNLALVMAEDRDRSVLLVDGDLHRPSIGKLLRRPPRIGLVDVFEGPARIEDAAVPLVQSRLHVLTAGRVNGTNPAGVLQSQRFHELLDELRNRYDRIIFDSPPIMRFVDANIINEHADGMIFVVRAGLTAKQMVRKALASVTSGRVLGLVMNDIRFTLVDRYYYRYDEYGKSYYDE